MGQEHRSALHYAAGDGHKAIVELLIKHPQIDPNSNDQVCFFHYDLFEER